MTTAGRDNVPADAVIASGQGVARAGSVLEVLWELRVSAMYLARGVCGSKLTGRTQVCSAGAGDDQVLVFARNAVSGKDEVPVIVLAGEVGPGESWVSHFPSLLTERSRDVAAYQVITLVSSSFKPLWSATRYLTSRAVAIT